MTKEIDYSPLFQFDGKSSEISLNFPNIHSTYDYKSLEIAFRDTHLYLGDKTNNLIWTVVGFDEVTDIINNQDSGVVDVKLKNGFISVCENNLGVENFEYTFD